MKDSSQIGQNGAAPHKSLHRFHWLIWAVLVALFAAAILLVPWRQVWDALASADPAPLLTALLICLAGIPASAVQWRLFTPRQFRMPFSRLLEIVSLSILARATLPFLAGDASSVGLLVVRGRLSTGAAVLVMTQEQLFTGIGKVAMVCATLVFASLPPFLVAAGFTLIAVISALFAVMLAGSLYGHALHGVAGLFPAALQKWVRKLAHLTAHLELFRHPLRTLGALLLTACKKGIEIGVTLLVAKSVGIELSLADAILVVTALDLASTIPGPPSGLGIFEAAAVFIYHTLGVPPGIALAAAVLQHAVYLGTDFLFGYAALTIAALRRKMHSGY